MAIQLDPTKIMKLLEKDIQLLNNTKSRLIKETDDLQKEVNDLAKQISTSKATLKGKEDALIAKYTKKEDELNSILTAQRKKLSDVKIEKENLKIAIDQHEKAETSCKNKMDEARALSGKANATLVTLKSVMTLIQKAIDTL